MGGNSVDGMIEKNLDKGHAFLATLALPTDGATTSAAARAAAAASPPPVCEPLAMELLRRGLLPRSGVESGGGSGGSGGRQARMPTVAGTIRTQLVCALRHSPIPHVACRSVSAPALMVSIYCIAVVICGGVWWGGGSGRRRSGQRASSDP